MTKAELIDTIAKSTGQPKKLVATTLDLAFDQIARSIRRTSASGCPASELFPCAGAKLAPASIRAPTRP